MNNSVVAVISAKDEEQTIGDLVSKLRLEGIPAIVVVADTTTDATEKVAGQAGAQVLRYPGVQTIRDATLRGWDEALSRQQVERIVQMDAGGSHNPEDAWRLISRLTRSRDADVVLGSRFAPDGCYDGPAWRERCSRLASWACRKRSGLSITDWTSGYRAFSRWVLFPLARATYQASMHGWHMEVLTKALEYDMQIDEIGISYRAGNSSLRLSGVIEAMQVWRAL